MENINNNKRYTEFMDMLENKAATDNNTAFKLFDAFCDWLVTVLDTAADIKTAFRILSRIKTRLKALRDETPVHIARQKKKCLDLYCPAR